MGQSCVCYICEHTCASKKRKIGKSKKKKKVALRKDSERGRYFCSAAYFCYQCNFAKVTASESYVKKFAERITSLRRPSCRRINVTCALAEWKIEAEGARAHRFCCTFLLRYICLREISTSAASSLRWFPRFLLARTREKLNFTILNFEISEMEISHHPDEILYINYGRGRFPAERRSSTFVMKEVILKLLAFEYFKTRGERV